MANLYKKPVWITDPKTGEKVKTKSKKWWGRYRDEHGVDRRVPLTKDKVAAQARLNDLVTKAERRAAGTSDPFEEHAKRPLKEHVDDFEEHQRSKGNSSQPDIRLTMGPYTHIGLLDQSTAIELLPPPPPLTPRENQDAALRATGTNGPIPSEEKVPKTVPFISRQTRINPHEIALTNARGGGKT